MMNREYKPYRLKCLKSEGRYQHVDIRTFISIGVPITKAVSDLMADIGDVRNLRGTPSEQMHITLRFIGDMDDSRIGTVCSCIGRAASGIGGFRIDLKGIGTFPDVGDPRILWIGASSGHMLERLSESIGDELDAEHIDHDRKAFRAHITVGRVSGNADLARILKKYEDFCFGSFECDGMDLMRSILGPHGAEHRTISRIELERALH